MRFDEAEAFLLDQRRLGMKFGLQNMHRSLERLGRPDLRYPSVIVAGSKGKGSVCAFLEAILLAAGHRPGLTSSPHLVSPCERIRVAGRPIAPRAFGRLIGDLRGRISRRPPLTYFEWVTVAALEHFARARAAPAILEVGLGGRLDATNSVDARIAVVTEIEREHVEFLGKRLGGIAAEKGGVMRRGAPCIIGASSPAARRSLAARAREVGALPRWLDREATWTVTGQTLRGVRMDLRTAAGTYRGLRLGILGRHQARNAALAVLAAEQCRDLGFRVTPAAVRAGLAGARWAGRCDWRPGRPGLFLDGAHTVGSARALRETLAELFPRRRTVMVFGALRDKNVAGMARILFPAAERVFLVRPPEERGAEPAELRSLAPAALRPRCVPSGSLPEALAAARRLAGVRGVVVLAGSLFLVGEAIGLLDRAPLAMVPDLG
jgi:dihydrofolate synthase/folylpolyglutamate synthase